jgi:anti-anti-sigma regulatory factor
MLKIVSLESHDRSLILHLEGRVMGPWVAELRRSCDAALTGGSALTLDLGGVSFIDGEGIALFRSLTGQRVVLENCSPFVSEQLRGVLR